jgi:hypothetical protein
MPAPAPAVRANRCAGGRADRDQGRLQQAGDERGDAQHDAPPVARRPPHEAATFERERGGHAVGEQRQPRPRPPAQMRQRPGAR